MLEVCAERSVSVLIRLESLGYPLHGHDLLVELCYCHDSARIDVEKIDGILAGILRELDYRLVDDVVGVKEAMVEDLLLYLLERSPRLGDVQPCRATARWRGRRVTVHRRQEP